ncbi:MAG: protein-glutamate O-methyltransferase CheR, partial [Thermoguttaceae bacterium]
MDLSRSTFEELRRLVHRLCGIVITDDKEYLVRHRLEPLVISSGCRDFEQFREKLASRAGVLLQEAIIEAITTQETSFFRDGHLFEALRRHVLPELVQSSQTMNAGTARSRIRFWSSGAATGQEPYSLAILICEYLAAQRQSGIGASDFSILATDISANALATATAAKYSRRDIDRGLSPGQVQAFFEQQGDRWALKSPARQIVDFRRINLMQTFTGLGTFHVILCRNVLIYFDEENRRRICEQFYAMLAEGG